MKTKNKHQIYIPNQRGDDSFISDYDSYNHNKLIKEQEKLRRKTK